MQRMSDHPTPAEQAQQDAIELVLDHDADYSDAAAALEDAAELMHRLDNCS